MGIWALVAISSRAYNTSGALKVRPCRKIRSDDMTDFNGLKKAMDRPEGVNEAWSRLDRDHYGKVEFAIQTHYLKKLVKPGESVIDICGEPGRYAAELLRNGGKVALAALSDGFLKKAEEEIRRQGLEGGLLAVKKQSPLRLDAFGNAQFDHALLMGPLIFMDAYEERRQALSEAARVVKGGGLIFLTMISNLRCVAEMFYVPDLKYRLVALENYSRNLGDILLSGLDRDAAVRGLIAACGLEIAVTYGTDSAAGMAFDKIDEMAASEETWHKMLDILIKLSADPSIAGLSSHTTYVLRKPA